MNRRYVLLSILQQLRVLLEARDKWKLVALVAMMIAGALAELLAVSSLMPVVAVITRPELFQQNKYLKLVYDLVQPRDNTHFIFLLALAVVLFYIVKNIYMAFLVDCQAKFIYRKNAELSSRLFKTYLDAPFPFFQKQNTASLLSNMEQLNYIPGNLLLPLMLIVTESFVILALVSLLLVFAPLTTLAAGCGVALLAVATYLPLKNLNYKLAQKRLQLNRQMYQTKNQTFGAIKEILCGNLEKRFSLQFQELAHTDASASRTLYVTGQLPRLVIESAVIVLSLGLIVGLISFGVAAGSVILTLAMLGAAMYRMIPSITRIHYNLIIVRQTLPVFEKIFHELTMTPARDAVSPDAPEIVFQHSLEIKNLTFGYNPGQPPVLQNFNLSVPRGDSVALVGQTGCGKSTLVDLILALQKPQSGDILVDGVSIYANPPSWQKKIGYVPQSIYLFDGSIRSNVAFGVPEPEIDDARIWECLRIAQIDGFVKKLPYGLAEALGERGVRLSGGQQQRIGIARALYHNPELLIFDEATSALDDETESAFVSALQELSTHVTVITIAHRHTTIEGCRRAVRIGRDERQVHEVKIV